MSVGGICHVCEQREGEHTCTACGAFVCSAHYRQGPQLCSVCADRRGDVGADDAFRQ
ncbi:hypothetical protein ACNS7O_03805 [Haloferacaceae archaeon DSL9]